MLCKTRWWLFSKILPLFLCVGFTMFSLSLLFST